MTEKQKAVPELRFKADDGSEFPEWEESKFGSVFDTVPTSSYQIPSSEVVKTGQYEVVDQGKRAIAGYSDSEEKLYQNTPVIVYGDHTTEVKFRYDPFIVGADGTKLLISQSKTNDLRYLYFALTKRNVPQEGYKRHFPILKSISIPLPSLPEQKKIAEFFSLLDERISKQADMVTSLREYKKGLSQRIFSRELRFKDENGEDYPEWEEKKLGELGEIVTGNTPSKQDKDNWENGVYPWVTANDFSGRNIIDTKQKLTLKGAAKSRTLPKNSLLVTCIASIGKNGILRVEGATNQQINALIPNETVNVDYVYSAMEYSSSDFAALAGKTAVPIINKTLFSQFSIPLPSLPEQEKIAALLSTMDSKIAKEEEKLAALREQKRGLMQRMFV